MQETGFIKFSQDEKKVYVGISEFVLGYQLATAQRFLKVKLPITFTDRDVRRGDSVISADSRFLAYNESPMSAVLVQLSPGGEAKRLHERALCFIKDDFIVTLLGSNPLKKVDMNKMDEFVESSNNYKHFFSPVSISLPTDYWRSPGVETIIDSVFYSFRMKEELGETIVNVLKSPVH